MKVVCLSKMGSGPTNEDAFLTFLNLSVFVVADGVGGGPNGGLASRTVVDVIYNELSSETNITHGKIVSAIDKANQRVHELSKLKNNTGMASTVALAWRSEDGLVCYNVGDSRIYSFGEEGLCQISSDHSKVIKRDGGFKSVVTRAIGIKPTIAPEISDAPWSEGMSLVLMSDGVSDQLDSSEIAFVLGGDFSALEKVNRLVLESERKGGLDDKTVVFAF